MIYKFKAFYILFTIDCLHLFFLNIFSVIFSFCNTSTNFDIFRIPFFKIREQTTKVLRVYVKHSNMSCYLKFYYNKFYTFIKMCWPNSKNSLFYSNILTTFFLSLDKLYEHKDFVCKSKNRFWVIKRSTEVFIICVLKIF